MRKKSKLFASSTAGTLISHINPIFSSRHSAVGRRAIHCCKTCRPLSNSLRAQAALWTLIPTKFRQKGTIIPLCQPQNKVPETTGFLCPPLAPKLHKSSLWQSQPREQTGSSSLIPHNHVGPGDKQMTFVLLGKSMAGRKKEGTEPMRNAHGKRPLTLGGRENGGVKGHCSVRVTLNAFWGKEEDTRQLVFLSNPFLYADPPPSGLSPHFGVSSTPSPAPRPPHFAVPHLPRGSSPRSPSPRRCSTALPHHAAPPSPPSEPWPGLSLPVPTARALPHRSPCGGGCAQGRRPGCVWAARAGRWRRRAPSAGPRSPTSRQRLCPIPVPVPIPIQVPSRPRRTGTAPVTSLPRRHVGADHVGARPSRGGHGGAVSAVLLCSNRAGMCMELRRRVPGTCGIGME